MTEEAAEKITGGPYWRRWISVFLKIVFCVIAVFLVIITVMANIGGSSDTLKKSIEEFVAENTVFDAKVGRLNNMSFFPDIAFDFDDTVFYRHGELAPVMHVEKVRVAFSFWDVMASTGKIKVFDIQEFQVLPGILTEKSLEVDRISIEGDDQSPRMEVHGKLGEQDFSISSGMRVSGSGRGKKYSFDRERDIEAKLGAIMLNCKMAGDSQGKVSFDNIEIKDRDVKLVTGNIVLTRGEERVIAHGDLKMEQHGTDISPDIDFYIHPRPGNAFQIEGTLASREFHVEDFAPGSGYDHVMHMIEDTFGIPETAGFVALTLDSAALYRSDKSSGEYRGPLPLKGWRIETGAIGKTP